MAKNPGPKLYFSQYGGEQPIPPEFIAAMNREEEVQPVPNDIGPEELSDTIVESGVSTNRTNERVRKTVKKKPGSITLRDIRTNQDGLPVQVTRTLFPTGTAPAIPTATQKVAVQDLGNGWSIQEASVQGRYGDNGEFIPDLFLGNKFAFSVPDTVPERFRPAILAIETDHTVVGSAMVPVFAPGDLEKSEEDVDYYKKRTHTVTRGAVTLPVTLLSKEVNRDKQDVVVKEIYKLAGTDTPSSATKDVNVQNLGDGRVVETQRTIPEVFSANRFEVSIPDTVPERFRVAVPVTVTEFTDEATAVLPILAAGDLQKSQEQLDLYRRRVRKVSRDSIATASLTDKETNERKQVVTAVSTYKDAGSPTAPTLLSDVEVQALADGKVIETVKSVPSLFTNLDYETSIPDTVPFEFQDILPKRTISETTAGTVTRANPPVLGATELSRRVQQVNAFAIRTETVDRDAFSYPKTLTDTFFGGVRDGSGTVFSGIATRERKLSLTPLDPFEDFTHFESQVKAIGQGQYLRESSSLATYPVLTDYDTDRETGAVIKRVKKIVANGAVPTDSNIEIHNLDSERAVQITSSIDTTVVKPLVDIRRVFGGKIDVQLPPELKSITVVVNAEAAANAYGSSGTYTISGKGSGGISLNGHGRGSAAVLPDIKYSIRQPWANDTPCTHYLFITTWLNIENNGPLTYVNTIRAAKGQDNALAWPKFAPQDVNIVLMGQKLSAEAVGDVHASEAITTDYNGVVKLSGSVRNTGNGGGFDIELSNKIVRIPPTIHPALNLTLPAGMTQSFAATGVMSTGVNSTPISVAGSADGSVTPTSIPATPGQSTIPTDGSYLYRFTIEPYGLDFCRVHAIVVDMSNLL